MTIDWTTVLVALATGLTAAIAPMWTWHKQAKRERDSVRAGLLAEVSALVELVEIRGYLGDLRKIQAEMIALGTEKLQALDSDSFGFRVGIPDHYNRVYQANVDKFGCLSVAEATQIVRFHQMADSVRADVTEGGLLFNGTNDPDAFGNAADLLEAAMKLGRQLTNPK